MQNAPVMVEEVFDAPIDDVWHAISEHDQLKQWYFDIRRFEPKVGFEFDFLGGTDKKQYHHLCEVTEVAPEKKLSYSWKYDGYSGNSTVSFELFPLDNKTKLRVTHEGLESFPHNNPDFAKGNFEKGWSEIVGKSLKDFVEKRQD